MKTEDLLMVNRIIQLTCLLVVLISLIGCGSISKGMRWMSYGSPVDDSELNRMVSSGTKMRLNWANGKTGTITYLANGKATMDAEGNSTPGTWNIKDNQLCLNWSPKNNGEDKCYSLYRENENTLKLFDEQGNHYADTSVPGTSS